MVKVAFLGAQFPQQVSTNPGELQDLQVAWMGDDPQQFRREAPRLGCQAVILDIADRPMQAAEVHELIAVSGAELALVTYGFATRAFLRELRGDHVRVLPAPLTLQVVRAHLAFLVVQDLLRQGHPARPATRARPLAKAQPVCRCADGVQKLIGELVAAEIHERDCPVRESSNERHQQLEGLTRQARVVLEDALVVARPTFEPTLDARTRGST